MLERRLNLPPYTPKMIDQALACFDKVFENVAVKPED